LIWQESAALRLDAVSELVLDTIGVFPATARSDRRFVYQPKTIAHNN